MSNWFWLGPTLAAILTILGYALFKWLQGEFNPSLSLNYRYSRVSISPGYSLYFIEVEAHNTSKVPVAVRYMEATLRRLSRYTDDEVENLYAKSFPEDGSLFQAIFWERISTVYRHWKERERYIQPGEHHQESFEFIVSDEYDTIPIQVDIQFVNRPIEEDLSFVEPVTARSRIGIIEPRESGQAE